MGGDDAGDGGEEEKGEEQRGEGGRIKEGKEVKKKVVGHLLARNSEKSFARR